MSVKLIGRTTNLYGKTLWEILGNLRTTGVGRLVTRNSYDRYEEPSFFKVLAVEPTAQIVSYHSINRNFHVLKIN